MAKLSTASNRKSKAKPTKASAKKKPVRAAAGKKKPVPKKRPAAKKAVVKKKPVRAAVLKKKPAAKKKVVAKKAVVKKKPAAKKKVVAKKAVVKKKPAAKKKVVAKKKPVVKQALVKVAVAKVAAPKVSPSKMAPPVVASPPPKVAPPARVTPPARPAIKPRKGPLDKFLLEQQALLREERDNYVHQAEALKAEADLLAREMEPGESEFSEEGGEGGNLSVERELDLRLSAQHRESADEVERALAKIDAGLYGMCEKCGQPIPRLRLRALPAAPLCVACKSGGLSRR